MPPDENLEQRRSDVLAEAYPQGDWTGFTPGNWWETGGIPNEFFASEYAKSLAPPPAAALYGTSASGTPEEFYGWFQGLNSEAQERFSDPFGLEQPTAPPVPEFDLEAWNALQARQQEMWQQSEGFLTERMDDDWSMFGPEARGALERRIGNQLGVARRNISGDLRRRGIYGSGIESQLEMDAQNIAAGSTADMLGQIAMADEAARGGYAQRYEGMRQFGALGGAAWADRAAGLSQDEFQLSGAMSAVGPVFEQMEALELFETQQQIDWLEDQERMAREAGNINLADIFELGIGMVRYGFDPIDFARRGFETLGGLFGG